MTRSVSSRGYHLSFAVRLAISFGVAMVLAIFAIGLLSHTIAARAIRENERRNLDGILTQMSQSLANSHAAIQRFTEQIIYDDDIQLLASEGLDFARLTSLIMGNVQRQLQKAMLIPEIDVRLKVYVRSDVMPEVYYVDEDAGALPADPMDRPNQFEIYRHTRLLAEPWFDESTIPLFGLDWRQLGGDEAFDNISALRVMFDLRSTRPAGLLRVIVDRNEFFRMIDQSLVGSGAVIDVTNGDGELLYRSGPAEDTDQRPERSLVLRKRVPTTGWEVIATVPNSYLEHQVRRVTRVIVLGIVIGGAVMAAIAALLTSILTSGMNRVIGPIDAFRHGQLDARIDYAGRDEFGVIGESFNQMADYTEKLINDVYQMDIARKEADLRVLQAQINPHFLYNTLSAMSKLIKLGKTEHAHGMVMALARFYRLTLKSRTGGPETTVAEELEQVDAYCRILAYLYCEALTVRTEIDPGTLDCGMLSFVIQPFIENAVGHGWDEDAMTVVVRTRIRDGALEIEIEDDGSGMTSHEIDVVFTAPDETERYGIRNVHRRIQLHYGPEYGVSITSAPGEFTRVTIRQPCAGLSESPPAASSELYRCMRDEIVKSDDSIDEPTLPTLPTTEWNASL